MRKILFEKIRFKLWFKISTGSFTNTSMLLDAFLEVIFYITHRIGLRIFDYFRGQTMMDPGVVVALQNGLQPSSANNGPMLVKYSASD